MQTNNYLRRMSRLLQLALVIVMLLPSMTMVAEDWSYPTKEPSNPFGGGNGKKDNPYLISTAQHLANLAYMVTSKEKSYSGKYFKLTNDIVLNDNVITSSLKREDNNSILYKTNKSHFDGLKAWQPIGRYGYMYDDDFKGIFDGNGHFISGLYLRKPLLHNDQKSYDHIGLFGNCKDARISNLTLKDCFISICNKDNDDELTTKVGSLIGLSKNTTITNCHTENCIISSDGDVTIDEWHVGGLVGSTEGSFICYGSSFDGMMDIYPYATYDRTLGAAPINLGGIVGFVDNTEFTIEQCETKGTLLFHQQVAGGDEPIYVGGILGGDDDSKFNKQSIARCVNSMDISIFDSKYFDSNRDVYAYGITSDMATCTDCANLGAINLGGNNQIVNKKTSSYSPSIYIGGICRYGKAESCFNYGNFSMPYMNYANGVTISFFGGEPTNCFNYNQISYQFDEGEATVNIEKDNNNIYYTSIYKAKDATFYKAIYNIEKEKFQDKNYPLELNNQLGSHKYGQLSDANSSYNGYLWLKSLGATMANLEGNGTETNPYIISSLSDLKIMNQLFSSDETTEAKVFKLNTNLDLTNVQGKNEYFEGIGSSSHPFDGVFDGAGHYIRGLKISSVGLFGVVTGTVKNLAIDNLIQKDGSILKFAGIAEQVGDGSKAALIENCTVTGNVDYLRRLLANEFGGICYNLKSGSTIKNCSFVGKVCVNVPNVLGSQLYKIAGIATIAEGNIENCFSTFEQDYYLQVYTENALNIKVGGIVAEKKDGATLKNNYYQKADVTSQNVGLENVTFDGVTIVDKNIDASRLGDAWINGFYHPVVKSTYHYDCKDYKGNAVALDQFITSPINNDILTLEPTDEYKADTKMWQLPNVAVYSQEYDAELLANFNIVPDTKTESYPLHYKPSKEGISVKGLANYPWVVNKNAVNWRSFCLPGEVDLANLPEGCKLYVGGKLVKDTEGTKSKMNIVEVETVPAGVPFLLRYDNQTDADTLYITMTGTFVMTPQKVDENSSLEGTFEGKAGGIYVYNSVTEQTTDGDTKVYMNNGSGAECFSGFAQYASTSQVELVNYLLLDEQSNETDEIVAAHNGKNVNVKLRRSIKTGGWNTVCLPFNVGIDEIETALGSGTIVEELSSINYDATLGSLVLQFAKATSVEAGKPYLVYPKNEGNIFDLGGRTIVGETSDKTYDVNMGDGTSISISMIGSYGKTALLSSDEESQYFIQQDKLYRVVGNPVVSLGYRCWFKVTNASDSQAQQIKAARIMHADGSTTDIKLVDTNIGSSNVRVFDLQGIQHNEMQKGLNIVGGKKLMK